MSGDLSFLNTRGLAGGNSPVTGCCMGIVIIIFSCLCCYVVSYLGAAFS